MGRMKENVVSFEFPYIGEPDVGWGTRVDWGFVPITREKAENLLREMAAELGYNLIKCVED